MMIDDYHFPTEIGETGINQLAQINHLKIIDRYEKNRVFRQKYNRRSDSVLHESEP
jgi:hypothetical protein